MRILYVLGGYGGEHLGGSIHRELAQRILAAGHQLEIFAPAHARHMGNRAEEVVEEGVRVHRAVCAGRPHLDVVNLLARPVFHFPWFLTSLLALRRVLRKSRSADVVMVESAYPFGAQVDIATRGLRMPFVIAVLGGDFIANDAANYGYGRYAIARTLMRRAFHRAAAVRAVSPYAARRAEALGCAPGKIAVVQRNIARGCFTPEGVELAAFRAAARQRVAQRFGVEAPRLVVAVGRLVPIKGFDHLLRALPKVIAALGETQLLLVGPNRRESQLGDYRRHLERLAATLGVAEGVVFTGALPHEGVRDALAAADVVAVPSVEEGGSKMVMEAGAVGTPVVSTASTGTVEWAKAWRCAVVVEPSNPESLAHGLLEVLGDPSRAASMSLRGPPFAQRFRPEPVAERILALCQVAARGGSLPPGLREPRELLHPEDGPAEG